MNEVLNENLFPSVPPTRQWPPLFRASIKDPELDCGAMFGLPGLMSVPFSEVTVPISRPSHRRKVSPTRVSSCARAWNDVLPDDFLIGLILPYNRMSTI